MIKIKFKVGNKVYVDWIGNLIECIVTNVYPNTDKYKINQEGWLRMIKENQLYATQLEYYEEYLKDVTTQIDDLQRKKKEIEGNLSRLSDNYRF